MQAPTCRFNALHWATAATFEEEGSSKRKGKKRKRKRRTARKIEPQILVGMLYDMLGKLDSLFDLSNLAKQQAVYDMDGSLLGLKKCRRRVPKASQFQS